MGALTGSVIAIAALILGWITVEIACKPCLDKGREAIDRNLNPDYDPDDDDVNNVNASIRAPLINPTSSESHVVRAKAASVDVDPPTKVDV